MAKTCFVVMAIGDQSNGDETVSSAALKIKYDTLIKEAIIKALPGIEVTRADDVSVPGTITTDIINRIMYSDIVVADVSYPNPNVFYELGLRHACRVGTVIIKDASSPKVPFDISHLRYVEYENSTKGLSDLARNLKEYFLFFEKHPTKPDNHFQEMARLMNYPFPTYEKPSQPPELQFLQSLVSHPGALQLVLSAAQGNEPTPEDLIQLFGNSPELIQPILEVLVQSGGFSFQKLLDIK